MDDLLREAIADAKAVRETALANAKIALEEAFTPRLQSMLSKKIATEMEDAEEEDAEERGMSEEEAEEMEDAEEMMDKDEMEDKDEMDKDEMEDKDEEEMDEMEDKDEEEMDEMEDKEEDELDLESVLAELEKDLEDEEDKDEMEMDESEDKDEEEKVDENDVSSEIGKADNKVADAANDSSKVGQGPEGEGSDKPAGKELGDHEVVKEQEDKDEMEDKDEEDLDLDEVLRALTEEDKEEEDAEENEKLKSEIQEHRKVINFMRKQLNEVNLMNAKLLFSNKLFRAFGLNNNQKLKVVENFDRTTNLREVKLVYATLAESFKKPSRLSESVKKGSSSKPVRSTKPAKEQVLSEGAELKARFKKLANIL